MIQIDNLSKQFGSFSAVNGLSFSVQAGEVLGFLGPNGAGKSTTMKMITGFLEPTLGRIEIFGHDIASEPLAVKRLIGYLPEGAPAWGDMTVKSFLQFIAGVRGLSKSETKTRISAVVDQLSLSSVLNKQIEALSKGFKRRVGFAQAILHDPKVLILDEPTDGLDPNQKQHVRELIANLAKDKIVIISTHILEEVDAVCSRALVINNGQVVMDGTPQELEARSRYYHAVTVDLLEDHEQALHEFENIMGVDAVEKDARRAGRYTLIPQKDQRLLNDVTALLQDKGWHAEELLVEKGRLDEVFRELTQSGASA